jgi:NADH-quinone oxidoreductase subunit L
VSFYLLILLPLIGFLINAFIGKKLPKNLSGIIGSAAILGSFVISCYIFFGFVNGTRTKADIDFFDWIAFNGFNISFGVLIDQLSATWLMVVTGIGFLIHVYSIGYMHDDEGFARFFSYLNLFVFFMLLLVMGNNFLVTFIGWEGVGLCSYLLIGFWYKNQDYNDAAKKAFVMNRIGDLGFLIAMFLMLWNFKTLNFGAIQLAMGTGEIAHGTIVAITLLLFVGAMGKSAQIPLYTWLPDAMAGPTPVSALIHAATMVTAGIYMIARANFMYVQAPESMHVVAVVGLATALFAATIGLMQNDIKKVLAYSTVSQLGLMFMALGLGAFTSGVFHVVTHAFFKACLFLGSGSVIHALHGEQDIRKMGGLRKWMPITFWTFLIASLAISGIPPFAGFFSKDEILAKAFEENKIMWALGSIASLMTAFYMFRLVYLTFFKEFRGTEEQKHHLHESPAVITFPLIVLAILSIVGGFIGLPAVFGANHWLSNFLAPVFNTPVGEAAHAAHGLSHSMELTLMGIAVAGAVLSILYARYKYISGGQLPANEGELTGIQSLVYRKYMIDELYEAIIVKPIVKLSEIAYEIIDKIFIDGAVVWVGKLSVITGNQVRKLQSGYIGFYLIAMVLSVIVMFVYAFIIK